jgi:hypothetical protein
MNATPVRCKSLLGAATLAAAFVVVCIASPALTQKNRTDISAAITTPDSVETRPGPDKPTFETLYDNLDSQRGVQAFLNAMPGASLAAMRKDLREVGVTADAIGIFETLHDPKSLFLTGNTETLYVTAWMPLPCPPRCCASTAPRSPGLTRHGGRAKSSRSCNDRGKMRF